MPPAIGRKSVARNTMCSRSPTFFRRQSPVFCRQSSIDDGRGHKRHALKASQIENWLRQAHPPQERGGERGKRPDESSERHVVAGQQWPEHPERQERQESNQKTPSADVLRREEQVVAVQHPGLGRVAEALKHADSFFVV